MWSNEREDTLSHITGVVSGEDFVPTDDFPTAHVIRAVAIDKRGNRSEVVSGTFFIGYDREALYGDIALMFLVTDPANLFDHEDGIYVLGKIYEDWAAEQTEAFESWQATGNFSQRGDEWERDVSVTYLPAEGEGFTQEMGVRIKGGASRGNSQKSLRLIARDEYGQKNVKYVLYPDNVRESDGGVVDKYKSFTLRNGGNDCGFGKIRDPFIQQLAAGLRFETAANMPVIAFINGEYWGLYTLNEEYTDNYIQYHYGIDNDNVITVKCGAVDDGEEDDIALYQEMFSYIADHDMSDPEHYVRASELLDMGSFADYCALQIYIANEDGVFQNNNWQMWRVREPDPSVHAYADGKWRMMLYDTDFSSGIYQSGGNGAEDNLTPVLLGSFSAWEPGFLFTSLIQNPDFQQEFILACCDIRNLYFSQKRASALLEEMMDDYLPYYPDTLRRFGPAWTLWNPENHCKSNMQSIGTFFTKRYSSFPDVVRKAFELGTAYTVTFKASDAEKGCVYINGRSLAAEPTARLKYFPEYPITVTAVPAEGATFVGWEVSSSYAQLSDPTAPTVEVTFSRAFTLTAVFE